MKAVAPARRLLSAVVALSLLAAACGDDDDGGGGATGGGETPGVAQRGGEVIYGLEAETTGGWCLPEAQLAISGEMVARSIYDTLTIPNESGGYSPYLAESVTPNDDNTEWTIVLRDGITFHDGSSLDATVVKNNLDAYRGQYPARRPLLFVFVFSNISEVTATDARTVVVRTATPWPALPAFLYGSGRVGMMAQAQLDDASNCSTNLIGTGPFELVEWVPNDHLSTTRNESYWQTDPNGVQLPYLDSLEFRPITDENQRRNALTTGAINAMHTAQAQQVTQLRSLANQGQIDLTESDAFGEVNYTMLNASVAPFDTKAAREAVALGFDREKYNLIQNNDILTQANGPFAPGNVGHLDDTGFPGFDPNAARAKVAEYEQTTGQNLSFTLSHDADPVTTQAAELWQQMMADVGIEVSLRGTDQSQLINQAIAGDFQANLWRNHPGGDPDTQYVWWHTGSPVNFGRFSDPEIDSLLDRGRTTIDPDERRQIYEDLNRRFAEEVWNVWQQYTLWAVATAPNVGGVYGVTLPDGSEPQPALSSGHPTLGLSVGS